MLSRLTRKLNLKKINREFATIQEKFAEVLPEKREQLARIKKECGSQVRNRLFLLIMMISNHQKFVTIALFY